MLPSLLAVALVAAPKPISVVAQSLTPVHVDKAVATFFGEHLAEQLIARGVRVITDREVVALLGSRSSAS